LTEAEKELGGKVVREAAREGRAAAGSGESGGINAAASSRLSSSRTKADRGREPTTQRLSQALLRQAGWRGSAAP